MKKTTDTDTVTIPRSTYEALKREVEEARDIRELLEAEAKAKPENMLPAPLVKRMLAGEHPLRIFREHRGLTLMALAERADVPNSYISEIETGKKPGSAKTLKALAEALDVDLDDLVP